MRLYHVKDPGDVLEVIKENFGALAAEEIELAEAGGRVAAQDITAAEDVPGFDRSTVDGFAVRADDTFGAGEAIPAMLELLGEVKMGQSAPPLVPGGCLAIPTGGMLPEGADAVVMLEQTEAIADVVNCYAQVAPGENVIRRGEDIPRGHVVIRKGKRLRAVEMGMLASLGVTRLFATKKPLVGIYSSGDEIVPCRSKELQPGKIRESNTVAIAEMIRKKRADVSYGGILSDNYGAFRQGIEAMLGQVDFIVLSGGSSVGARDFTAEVLREMSDEGLLVEGVAIAPGKPTLLAKCAGIPVLGLPGHPVSALNIFSLFGLAILDRLQGRTEELFSASVRATLNRNVPSRPGRTDYVRVKLVRSEDTVLAIPLFGKSGILSALAEAHGIFVIPSGSEGLLAGTAVEVFLWD